MEPILVVMAAGMGSRYGGLKQIDKIGPNGETILELSVYDAIKAGFKSVVFILREEIQEDFKELIGNKLLNHIDVKYVFQDINNIPKKFVVPEGRKKPWGTGHAILCVKEVVKTPFVVINADDYYGTEAFVLMYDFLNNNKNENEHSMVGYKLCNTLSEYGHVARGICEVKDGYLEEVVERTKILNKNNKAFFTEDENLWHELDCESIVSMNMWGFKPSIFNTAEVLFSRFLDSEAKTNPLKSEFYIPLIVSNILNEKKAKVKVMGSKDKWYGVTYKEDKESVRLAISKMVEAGIYKKNLWGEIN